MLHMNACLGLLSKDIGQMLATNSKGVTALRGRKFDQEKYREFPANVIDNHNLSFAFVEYDETQICTHILTLN